MTIATSQTPVFVRRTTLAANEYRKNFHQIDADIIAMITSPAADAVTPLMSKIYLRLVNAPRDFWEQNGVLHFTAQVREGEFVKASTVLSDYLGVAPATLSKSLKWMHDKGVIGYFAGKNGVGMRIFLNRAANSIGTRSTAGAQKILRFSPGSSAERHGSSNEPPFNDSFAVSESSDTDVNPHAPKNGADTTEVGKATSDPAPASTSSSQASTTQKRRGVVDANSTTSGAIPVEEIVKRLQSVLEPSLKTAAVQAAQREHERTREWLDKHGIPKATRVAQKEAFNVLRSHGLMDASAQRLHAELQVGRSSGSFAVPEARPRTPEEIIEVAEMCVALLEVQGKSVEVTLSEISAEAGGWLLPEDAPLVREAAQRLMLERNQRR